MIAAMEQPPLTRLRTRILGWGNRVYGSSSLDFPQILQLLWPLLLDQLFMRILNVLNTTMVSSYGPEAVSAVSIIDSFNFFVINFFVAIATGCTVVVAQYCGRGDRHTANEAAAQAVGSSVLMALLVCLVLVLFPDFVIGLLLGKADPLMQEHARTFLIGSAISYPFYAMIQTILGAMRGAGATKASVYFSSGLNLANVLGNVVFLNIFRFGVLGLSISTVASRVIFAGLSLLYMLRSNRELALRPQNFLVPNLPLQRSILYVALPTGLEQVFFHAGRILTQVFVVGYGTMSATANAIVLPFSSFLQVCGSTMQMGIVTIVGQCIGAGKTGEAKRYIKIITLTGVVTSALVSLIFVPILPGFLSLYNLPGEAYHKALWTCILVLVGTPVTWPGSFIVPAGLRAAGDAGYTSVVSMLCMWLIRVLLGYFLGTVMGFDLYGIWIAMFAEWIIRSVIFGIRSRGDRWLSHKVI